MRAVEAGLLIYVGSTTSQMIYPFQGPYEASKARWTRLAEVTRYETARYGIDVVIVTAGAIMRGTQHFSEGTRPADLPPPRRPIPASNASKSRSPQRLMELSPPDADPRAVGEEILRIVALPAGRRPFRPMVDFLHDGAEQVNATAERAQAALMNRLESLIFCTRRRKSLEAAHYRPIA